MNKVMKTFCTYTVLLVALIGSSIALTAAEPRHTLYFNGADAYVETSAPVIPSSGDFTVESWVCCPEIRSSVAEVLSQGSGGNAFYLGAYNGNVRLGDSWGNTGVPFPVGGWHHFAVVKTSTNTTLYIDGTNRISRASAIPNPTASTGLRFGRQYNGFGEYWLGSIADLRVWNVARTAAQVRDNFNANPTGKESGLVACWLFKESYGTRCSSVGSANIVGSFVNDVRWVTSSTFPQAPEPSSALSFNGTSDYIETDTSVIPSSGDFTVESWANCPAPQNAVKEIMSQGSTGNSFYLGQYANNIIRVSDSWSATGVTLPAGGWHHFAVVKSSTNTILFIDGILRAARGSAIPNPSAYTGLRIGRQYGADLEYWKGGIDGVRVWSVARSAAEIFSNRFATLTGSETGLEAAWQFGEARGNVCMSVGRRRIVGRMIGNPRWDVSGAWVPRFNLFGANPMTVLQHSAFVDPGAVMVTPVVGIGAGEFYSLARKADGTLAAWDEDSISMPEIPAAATNIISVAAGHFHTLALRSDGNVVGSRWDWNDAGAADGSMAGSNVIAVAGGYQFSLALHSSGLVNGWSWGDFDQTNGLLAGSNVVAISAGPSYSLALKSDGSVVGWGDNSSGTTNIPSSATKVIAISAGESHCLALREDGTVVGWGGDNTYGERDAPPAASNIIAIAAGSQYSMALKSDGTIIAWGYNPGNRMDGVSACSNVTAIAVASFAFSFDALAVKSDGSVLEWGKYGMPKTVPVDQMTVSTPIASGVVNTNVLGSYQVAYRYTNTFGELMVSNRTVLVVAPPSFVEPLPDRVAYANSTAVLTANVVGTAPMSFLWFGPDGLLVDATNSVLTLPSVTPSIAGSYHVIVSNTYGVATSRVASLSLTPDPVVGRLNEQTVFSGHSVALKPTIVGEGPFSYQWQHDGTNLADGIICTVIGNGAHDFYGDGGPALSAGIGGASCIAVSDSGAIYFVDDDNFRIRKVTVDGIITTIAGIGSRAIVDDGGWAINASIDSSSRIKLDHAGNLLIASMCKIRKIDTQGHIFDVAGTGKYGYSGDGGPATDAELNSPWGMAVDKVGNIFFAELFTNCIRKVDAQGIISTVAGTGIAGFSGDGGMATNAQLSFPYDLAVDANGGLIISDQNNMRVRRIDADGKIATLVGNGIRSSQGDGGPAVNASIYPIHLALDSHGGFLVQDADPRRIRRVDSNGVISAFAGTESGSTADGIPAANARFYYVRGMAFDDCGNLLVGAGWNPTSPQPYYCRIRKISSTTGPALRLYNFSANDFGNYRLILKDLAQGVSFTNEVASLQPATPPVIASEPLDVLAFDTMAARLTVTALGSQPLSYQWYQTNGLAVAGATNEWLTWAHAAATDPGGYRVVVSNQFGLATSRVAVVTLLAQPANQSVESGGRTRLALNMPAGGAYSYQWQHDGTNLNQWSLRTVAGNGSVGFSGDGGLATLASLNNPLHVAVDRNGNLFIVDSMNFRIRKVGVNGRIATVAGNGENQNGGEGLPASATSLNDPVSVAVDAQGNLYIAEANSSVVRKVGPDGLLKTFAGIHQPDFSGDGGLAVNAGLRTPVGLAVDSAGNLFIADVGNNDVRKVSAAGFISSVAGGGNFGAPQYAVLATNYLLSCPRVVAGGMAGELYIGDLTVLGKANQVLRVNAQGMIDLVAGNLNHYNIDEGILATNATTDVGGLAVDNKGNIYVSDTGLDRIRQIGTNGIIHTVIDNAYDINGIPQGAALVVSPRGLSIDDDGNLFICDAGHNRVCQAVNVHGPALALASAGVEDQGNYRVIITDSVAGLSLTSAVATVSLVFPPYLTSQPTNTVSCAGYSARFSATADGGEPLTYRWYQQGAGSTVAGTGATLVLSNLAENQAGNYFVVVSNSFGSVTSALAHLTLLAPPRFLSQPLDLSLAAADSGTLSVSMAGAGPFTYQWQRDGTNLPQGIITTLSNLNVTMPVGLAFDSAGNLFMADGMANQVIRCSTNGVASVVAGTGVLGYSGDQGLATNARLTVPYGVAFDRLGNLLISDAGTNRIRSVDANGIITTMAGIGLGAYYGDGNQATNAMFNVPAGLDFDASGNLFVGDMWNNRIRRIATNGVVSTFAGNGNASYAGDGGLAINASLKTPFIAIDDAHGNVYISDLGNNCVRKVNPAGVIVTVAGNPLASSAGNFTGDLGPATNALLNAPAGLALDAAGNLYIAEIQNMRVRRVDSDGIITTVIGNGQNSATGDNGPAVKASIRSAYGLVFDRSGALYVSCDGGVRKVSSLGCEVLTLGSASSNTWGSYRVIVTSLTSGGSITSAVAVVSQPQLRINRDAALGFLSNRFGFTFSSSSSQTVVVEASTNPAALLWTPLQTNKPGTNQTYFSDPKVLQFPYRFYRLRAQ